MFSHLLANVATARVKRNRPMRPLSAPSGDATAFANNTEIRVRGLRLELSNDNQKRVRQFHCAGASAPQRRSPGAQPLYIDKTW